MRDHLDAFARHLASANHAPRTVKTYRTIIASFAAFTSSRAGPPTRAAVVRRLEGTVPQSILPAIKAPVPPPAKVPLPMPPEPRGSPGQFGLDDQCGLVAQSPPITTTNINEARSSTGARCRFSVARCVVAVVEEAP